MGQITVRGVRPEVARRLKRMGRERGESMNATVLRILQQAVGLDARRTRLARYATWTEADLRQFDLALGEQRTIDAELWR